jgi:hypothetical protein
MIGQFGHSEGFTTFNDATEYWWSIVTNILLIPTTWSCLTSPAKHVVILLSFALVVTVNDMLRCKRHVEDGRAMIRLFIDFSSFAVLMMLSFNGVNGDSE